MPAPPPEIDGFRLVAVPRVPWPVYTDGDGPPVVLLHEVMGLTHTLLALGRRLVDADFTVYAPALVGPVPAEGGGKLAASVRVCVSREVRAFRTGRTSPAVAPLTDLARYAVRATGARGAGVVGLCFTGGFAIAATCASEVLAGVAGHHSMPWRPWGCGDLGLDPGDLATVNERIAAGDAEVYLTRFTADRIAPRAKRERAEAVLHDVVVDELDSGRGNPYGFRKGDHSVLSVAPRKYPADSPAGRRLRTAFDDVAAFLHRRLDAPPPTEP